MALVLQFQKSFEISQSFVIFVEYDMCREVGMECFDNLKATDHLDL